MHQQCFKIAPSPDNTDTNPPLSYSQGRAICIVIDIGHGTIDQGCGSERLTKGERDGAEWSESSASL